MDLESDFQLCVQDKQALARENSRLRGRLLRAEARLDKLLQGDILEQAEVRITLALIQSVLRDPTD